MAKKKEEKNKKEKDKKVVKEGKEEVSKKVVDEDEFEEEVEEFDDEDEGVELSNVNTSSNPNSEYKSIKILLSIGICFLAVIFIILLLLLNKVSSIAKNYETYGATTNDGSQTSDQSTDAEDYDVSMFEEISMDEFKDWLEDEDDDSIRLVYTGRSTCSVCVAFLPTLQQSVEDYDYTLYYLNTGSLTQSLAEEIQGMDEVLGDENSLFGSTPMVYAIKNGKVIDVNAGYTEYSTYEEFLKNNDVEEK